MKNTYIKSIVTMLIIFVVVSSLFAQVIPESYKIEGVPHHPMLDGFCAMSSLWMNLEYYGINIDVAKLLNMGWSYGFFYWKTPSKEWVYPNTGPVEEMVFVARELGLEVVELRHKSLEEAKKTLVDNISRNIPVLVQTIGHTVLAIGYEKGGDVIIYNDPSDPQIPELIDMEITRKEIPNAWADRKRNLSAMDKPPYLWGVFGYGCVIVKPGKEIKRIDWKKIWIRAADKTLGKIRDDYPAIYGVDGIKAVINDLKNREFTSNDQLNAYLLNFEGAFFLGTGFRREAAAFLSGQASLIDNPDLSRAAAVFRNSAHLYRSGYNALLWLKKDAAGAEILKPMILGLFEKILESEIKGAELLYSAAKK